MSAVPFRPQVKGPKKVPLSVKVSPDLREQLKLLVRPGLKLSSVVEHILLSHIEEYLKLEGKDGEEIPDPEPSPPTLKPR